MPTQNKNIMVAELHIRDHCFKVIRLVGDEKLSDLPQWRINIIVEHSEQLLSLKRCQAKLKLQHTNGKQRIFAGLITAIKVIEQINHAGWQVQIIAEPQLCLSRYHSQATFYSHKNVLDCAKDIIHKYHPASQIRLKINKTYSPLPFILHYPNETDFAFIQRLLGENNISYYYQFIDTKSYLVICDDNYSCSLDKTTYYYPKDFYKLKFNGNDSIIAKSNICNLYPGLKVTIDTSEFDDQPKTSCYLITNITHHYDHQDYYENTLTMITADQRYCSRTSDDNNIPANLMATIISVHDNPELNKQGYYQLQFDFSTRTSPPIPMLLANHKMHTPLHNNTKVMVGFINDDPNSPVIIGGVNDDHYTHSPVTNENQQQSIYQTYAGNRLIFDDNVKSTLLANNDDMNRILFSNKDGITLQSQGDIKVVSKDKVSIHSNNTINENIGNKISRCFKKHYTIKSLKGGIEYGATHNQSWYAQNNIHCIAKQSIQYRAQTVMSVSAEQSLFFSSVKGSINLQALGGLQLSCAKNIKIIGSGVGNINIGNAKAGITILADGSMIFYGDAIHFDAKNIDQKGLVSYSS